MILLALLAILRKLIVLDLAISFEKMAMRDAVKSRVGAEGFARGLFDFLHGPGTMERKFEQWCAVVANLPRKQTRVSTWPIVTVFGFIAQPDQHILLAVRPRNTATHFHYRSRPA